MGGVVSASAALQRALAASAAAAGVAIHFCNPTARTWTAPTFVGARHFMRIEAGSSPHLQAWLETLSDDDLPMRGHLVADVVVTSVSDIDGTLNADLEVLTVEDH